MKKRQTIFGYRRALILKLDKRWEWESPIWFKNGMFADAWIKCARDFDTEADANANMTDALKRFGITKKTKRL